MRVVYSATEMLRLYCDCQSINKSVRTNYKLLNATDIPHDTFTNGYNKQKYGKFHKKGNKENTTKAKSTKKKVEG